jgi:hypothetical protein
MILRLRQRHRRVFIALGIFLPVALAVGIAARRPIPVMENLSGLTSVQMNFPIVVWTNKARFAQLPIEVELQRESENRGYFGAKLTADKNFLAADALVYWVTGDSTSTNALPRGALLLGSFDSSTTLPIPPRAETMVPGELLLYSLANKQVLGISTPFTVYPSK